MRYRIVGAGMVLVWLVATVWAATACQDWPLCDEGCLDGQRCIEGECVDDPCLGKDCGPDGHGGSCGSCAGVCREGQCHRCPEEMVPLAPLDVCIDRYEASRGAGGVVRSVAGATPWTEVTFNAARAACTAAGKRLCSDGEWTRACAGHDCGLLCIAAYPYGAAFDGSRCIGQRPASEPKRTAPELTGSAAGCEGGLPGLFDMTGNVREWVDSCTSTTCKAAGGSFASGGLGTLNCGAVENEYDGIDAADWYGDEGLRQGFRCCLSL